MGRDKGQRTKGNAKPASSDRSAQLLAFPQTTASTAGFGFSGFSGTSPGVKPTFESLAGTASYVPILDDSLDPKLALPLRKLGKKDPTTKIKALSELITLCKEDSSIPPQILPFYPSIYTKLSTDESKKVRELAQSLLQVISTSVGRTLATQLKQILPSWYLSINDTFPPAASVALNSFKLIFPTEEKQIQSLKFCLAEIGELVKERIFSREEFDKITGLEGLKKILHIAENDYIFGILKDDRFWPLAKDEFGQIRSSFYSLLSSLGESHAEYIPKSKLTKALTAALKEEKFELSSLWNCFITLTTNGIFNEKDTARKELLVLCRNSFYGNAAQLGPLVLPLVHKIEEVGEELFVALEEGFEGSSSNSEKLAIISTYAEALAYFLKHENQLPATIIPFLTCNLKQACEFSRTISPMLKSNTSLYEALVDALPASSDTSSEPLPKEYGNFILSFLERRKCVSFEEPSDATNSGPASAAYGNLPEAKRKFVQSISRRLLELHAFKPFSVLSRAMKSADFYQDVLDLAQIPTIFHSSVLDEDSRIELLRVALDLIQTFPNAPTCLLLFSTVYAKFFSSEGRDSELEAFIRELAGFDDLKPIRNWLRMDLFTKRESPAVLKYILRKGATFPEAVVQAKIQQLCERFDPETVHDLLIATPCTTDLTPIYEKSFQLYLSDKTEELESLCHLIVEQDVLTKPKVYDLLLSGLSHCATVSEISGLVENFALRVVDDAELFKLSPVDCGSIDADFLVFYGFKYPKLQFPSGIAPWGQFNPLAAMKQVIFETKIGLVLGGREHLIQLGLNLTIAHSLYTIWDEAIGLPKIPPQFLEELTSCQAKVVDKIVEDKKTTKEFWAQLLAARDNEVWGSKYPLKCFLKLAAKMELSCFKLDEVARPSSLDNIQSVVQEYLLNPKVAGSELVTMLEAVRNDQADQFQFEKLFAVTSDVQRQRMFDLLALTVKLMQRNPEFLTNATCWISAWILMAKNIQHTKTNYLWIIELCRAVITIDRLVKDVKGLGEFVTEYIEFHAKNLYPNMYSWIDQLLVITQDGQSPSQPIDCWRLQAGQVAVSALALAPKAVFNFHVEQNSDTVFTKFVPILKRSEMQFKMGAYKILRKVTIKDDIIVPKELLSYLEAGMPDNTEHEEETGVGNEEATISYLLAWDILLTCQPNTADLANFVKCDEFLPRLLSLIFLKWIPQHPKQYFETEFKLTASTTVPQLACYVLHRVLSCLPYTVRWWWTGLLKQRDKVLVEKIITKYLSGKLAAQELSRVKLDKESDHITVLSHPGCNELVARYKFEETSVTLTISLPLNYPLGPVSIQVSDPKLHARISQLLNSRSHSLSAGLKLWKQTLDDTYKDVDECTICFYVIHHATKQLPKLDCRTCRKKFHSACLYKWFSTSNKSECPLCKSLW